VGTPRFCAQSAAAFRVIPEAEIDKVGRLQRIGRLCSKLIFFLTIDNSPALNGPVATQVHLVNRMLVDRIRFASGSTRFLPLRRCARLRNFGAVSCLQRQLQLLERSGTGNPGLKRTDQKCGSAVLISVRRGSDSSMQPQQ
jgi:hypothetical protein